jgi:hypothetical protein
MSRRNVRVTCVVCLVFGCAIAAFAALPPGMIDEMRVQADEAIIIEVANVTTEKQSDGDELVKADAKVLGIERSKSKLEKGATIRIEYTRAIDNRPGPGWPAVIEKGAVVPAFLNKAFGKETFHAAAHGGSFTMTPEKTPPKSQ